MLRKLGNLRAFFSTVHLYLLTRHSHQQARMNYQTSVRISKCIVAFSVGFFCFIVGLNNILDYNTNLQLVKHVLSMDAMKSWFDGTAIQGRAIVNDTFHHLAYWIIIILELLAGIICLAGSITMVTNINTDKFITGKSLYLLGATLAILIWYFGFAVIGAEWFAMWASEWNSQATAYRFSFFILLSMCFIHSND